MRCLYHGVCLYIWRTLQGGADGTEADGVEFDTPMPEIDGEFEAEDGEGGGVKQQQGECPCRFGHIDIDASDYGVSFVSCTTRARAATG